MIWPVQKAEAVYSASTKLAKAIHAPALKIDDRYSGRSFDKENTPEKNECRRLLVDAVLGLNKKHTSFLCLPGPWWHFEHEARKTCRMFYFNGCEKHPALYAAAVHKLPLRKGAYIGTFYANSIGCQGATNGLNVKVFNCDIQTYIEKARNLVDVVWLDYYRPISLNLISELANLPRILKRGPCLVAVTFMVGREDEETFSYIQKLSRPEYIAQSFLKILGPSARVIHQIQYRDSVPMILTCFELDGSSLARSAPERSSAEGSPSEATP